MLRWEEDTWEHLLELKMSQRMMLFVTGGPWFPELGAYGMRTPKSDHWLLFFSPLGLCVVRGSRVPRTGGAA